MRCIVPVREQGTTGGRVDPASRASAYSPRRASSKKPTMRRSYSAGWASKPPTWRLGIPRADWCPARDLVVLVFGGLLDRCAFAPRRRRTRCPRSSGRGRQALRRQVLEKTRSSASRPGCLERAAFPHAGVASMDAGRNGRAAPSETTPQVVCLGGGLDHHLAADGEADAADPLDRRRDGPAGSRPRQGCPARPASRTGSVALALPSPRRSKRRTP